MHAPGATCLSSPRSTSLPLGRQRRGASAKSSGSLRQLHLLHAMADNMMFVLIDNSEIELCAIVAPGWSCPRLIASGSVCCACDVRDPILHPHCMPQTIATVDVQESWLQWMSPAGPLTLCAACLPHVPRPVVRCAALGLAQTPMRPAASNAFAAQWGSSSASARRRGLQRLTCDLSTVLVAVALQLCPFIGRVTGTCSLYLWTTCPCQQQQQGEKRQQLHL
jgi:hypothetical protein